MITDHDAFEKVKYFCAYQERCHQEVLKKLRQLKVWGFEADEMIAALIQEDYLNEERYACCFARGKFRMKQWGRNKIRTALKAKGISVYCLKKAMLEIDEETYQETLNGLARKKYQSLKRDQYLQRKYKTQQYLIRKGYEPNLVYRALETVMSEGSEK